MAHARSHPPEEDHSRRNARRWRSRSPDLLLGLQVQPLDSEVLILVAESNGGPTMMARIGVMRALNRNVERVFTSRKDHHWGKRKLARDQ
jgi:hypothetical protein